MADAVRDQVVRTWSDDRSAETDPFAARGNVQRTPEASDGPAQSDFSSGHVTDRNLSAVSPVQAVDGQLGGGTIWADGLPGGSMQAGTILGLSSVTQGRATSPTYGATPGFDASSAGVKPTRGASHSPFSDSSGQPTQPGHDDQDGRWYKTRERRPETNETDLDGLGSISMNVGTATPITSFHALSFTAPDKGVHGEMSLFDPSSLDEDVDGKLQALTLKLTDPDVLKDLMLQHPDMVVMREFHQKKNGFNDILHEMMDKGIISPEVANQLSQKMHAQFYQHVTRAFNNHAMPILIESFRANLINQIPRVMNQVETVIKGLRLHVGAGSSESSFDHVEIVMEINGTCRGIMIFNDKKNLAVRNLSALAVNQLPDVNNIYGFLASEISSAGVLESKSLDSGNEDVKRLAATIATMESTCVNASCMYVQRTPSKKDVLTMKNKHLIYLVRVGLKFDSSRYLPSIRVAVPLNQQFWTALRKAANRPSKIARSTLL
jgi:hypothetical protein